MDELFTHLDSLDRPIDAIQLVAALDRNWVVSKPLIDHIRNAIDQRDKNPTIRVDTLKTALCEIVFELRLPQMAWFASRSPRPRSPADDRAHERVIAWFRNRPAPPPPPPNNANIIELGLNPGAKLALLGGFLQPLHQVDPVRWSRAKVGTIEAALEPQPIETQEDARLEARCRRHERYSERLLCVILHYMDMPPTEANAGIDELVKTNRALASIPGLCADLAATQDKRACLLSHFDKYSKSVQEKLAWMPCSDTAPALALVPSQARMTLDPHKQWYIVPQALDKAPPHSIKAMLFHCQAIESEFAPYPHIRLKYRKRYYNIYNLCPNNI